MSIFFDGENYLNFHKNAHLNCTCFLKGYDASSCLLGNTLFVEQFFSEEFSVLDILIPASAGELIDKITILEIKVKNIRDPEKNRNVVKELEALDICLKKNVSDSHHLTDLRASLKSINETLWDIEDDIRLCEQRGDFGDKFIKLARSVYRQNDKRAAVKKEINVLLGSSIIEEKSYADYTQG